MRFDSLMTVASLAVVVCTAAPLNNNNPTIWAQSSITVMKQQIDRMYSFNLGLYQQRHILDNGGVSCVVPPPAPHYYINNTCPNGNKLASDAILSVATAWKSLASTMFPVFYNLSDTAGQPRASFSDFSHFYNHFLLEIQSLQNTSSYYHCKANIRPNSDFWNSIYTAWQNSTDYVVVRFGPIIGYINNGPVQIFANNGTEMAYNYASPFEVSIRNNIQLMADGFEDLLIQMSSPGVQYDTKTCKHFQNGLQPPKPPYTFH